MKNRRRVMYIPAVVVAVLGLGTVAYAADAAFPDIAGHWAQDSITNLADRGIIEGHADGNFGPDEPVTRAQVATFLDRLATEEGTPVAARRGCADCHAGKYSLKNEAVLRGGDLHAGLPDDADMNVCLACHASTPDGKGKMAPISLRDIVHPVHMGSKIFVGHYMGNCFTCHNVDAVGTFQVLVDAVDTKDDGIPLTLPIPGAQDPK